MEKENKDKRFEEDFKILRDEVMTLHRLIEFYKAIFNLKNEKIIKEEFPNFFVTIQILITENVILRLARLMDPYEQGKRNKNLTWVIILYKSNFLDKAVYKLYELDEEEIKLVEERSELLRQLLHPEDPQGDSCFNEGFSPSPQV